MQYVRETSSSSYGGLVAKAKISVNSLRQDQTQAGSLTEGAAVKGKNRGKCLSGLRTPSSHLHFSCPSNVLLKAC